MTGSVETEIGQAPRVSSELEFRDRLGTLKARLAIGRGNYRIDPGLYAIGEPDQDSPVLASANYKMSFDRLRESLPGRNAWILVLDTDGVNVWCAAGKGTFGTDELVGRIRGSHLKRVISHRRIIVPQLGASGVSAHETQSLSGFRVKFGPVRAADLPEFIDSGYKATPAMRRKTFTTAERLALVPVECVHAFKMLFIIMPSILILGGLVDLFGRGGFIAGALGPGLFAIAGLVSAIFAGCVLTPLLLPWLPGRAFAAKGILPGAACALLFLTASSAMSTAAPPGLIDSMAWMLIIPAVSAYLAMNYTGCSTFTSLSGVKKEMRAAVPLEIGAAALGIVLWVVSRFVF